jgi:hypothetical protein
MKFRLTKIPYRRKTRLRAGFTLMEMMLSLILLTAAFGLGVELMRSMMRVWNDTAQVSSRENRLDSALFRLRKDVWNSQGFNVNDPSSVELSTADGGKINWHIESDGAIKRTGGSDAAQTWDSTAGGWHFEKDENSLIVIDDKSQNQIPLRLPSQIILATRLKP